MIILWVTTVRVTTVRVILMFKETKVRVKLFFQGNYGLFLKLTTVRVMLTIFLNLTAVRLMLIFKGQWSEVMPILKVTAVTVMLILKVTAVRVMLILKVG